jgi:hypothetical protein
LGLNATLPGPPLAQARGGRKGALSDGLLKGRDPPPYQVRCVSRRPLIHLQARV